MGWRHETDHLIGQFSQFSDRDGRINRDRQHDMHGGGRSDICKTRPDRQPRGDAAVNECLAGRYPEPPSRYPAVNFETVFQKCRLY